MVNKLLILDDIVDYKKVYIIDYFFVIRIRNKVLRKILLCFVLVVLRLNDMKLWIGRFFFEGGTRWVGVVLVLGFNLYSDYFLWEVVFYSMVERFRI